MTELINDTLIEDLSAILSSCAEGEKRKTFFEIDEEFEINNDGRCEKYLC